MRVQAADREHSSMTSTLSCSASLAFSRWASMMPDGVVAEDRVARRRPGCGGGGTRRAVRLGRGARRAAGPTCAWLFAPPLNQQRRNSR
jgi:hypothetical protein